MRESQNRLDNKGFKIALIALIVLVILFLIYELLISPFIAYLFRDIGYKDCDITSYQTQSYMRYDGGEEAAAFFPRYEVLSDWETVEFYYKDNSIHNNVFFGKMPDIYKLKIRYSPEIYAAKVAEAIDPDTVMKHWESDFQYDEYYIINCDGDQVCAICTDEDLHEICYVFINDWTHADQELSQLDYLMTRLSSSGTETSYRLPVTII